jgi:hypothetical protein
MSNYDIGSLSSSDAPYSIDDYYVSTYDSTDVFEFDLFGTSDINLALTPSGGDADLSLYLDNGDGYFDPSTDTYVAYVVAPLMTQLTLLIKVRVPTLLKSPTSVPVPAMSITISTYLPPQATQPVTCSPQRRTLVA